jgi:hypothetical protein
MGAGYLLARQLEPEFGKSRLPLDSLASVRNLEDAVGTTTG